MPAFSKFEDSHRIVPLDLTDPVDYAPALSIYYDVEGEFGAGADYNIQIDNNTGISLVAESKTIIVPFVNRNTFDIQSDIVSAGSAFKAVVLNEGIEFSTGELSFNTGDITPDGGHIIRMNRHVVKYNEETRIRLLPPYNEPRDFPWYARINVGQFSKDHLESRHIFNIPEYRNQIWSPSYGHPYLEVFGEEPKFLDQRRVQVARRPVLWRDHNISIRIQDREAYATIIEDVDENNGIIYLNTDIKDVNGVSVSYAYKENSYIYKHLDLNPSVNNNPYIIGQWVLFYIIPERSQPGNEVRTRTVFHKVSKTLLGAIYSLPRYLYPITLLGALQVRQTNSIDDLQILDTRTRGGGIKEEKYIEAISKNKNAHSVADLGRVDGIPYPGSSVLIYKLPEELKDTLEVEDIRQRAKKHLAFGVTPIVEFE